MDYVERDAARRFQGERLVSAAPRKTVAHRLGVSEQRVGQHARGECSSISYEQLRKLSRCDLTNALAVVNGARLECETAALEGKSSDALRFELVELLDREQRKDGEEDPPQQQLAMTLAVIGFMEDRMNLPLRRQLASQLDAWIEAKLSEMDVAFAALARARALKSQIEGGK